MSHNVMEWGVVRPYPAQLTMGKDEDQLIDEGIFQDKYLHFWQVELTDSLNGDEGFCELEPFGNGGYRFRAQYYNGGSDLTEVLQEALEDEYTE